MGGEGGVGKCHRDEEPMAIRNAIEMKRTVRK